MKKRIIKLISMLLVAMMLVGCGDRDKLNELRSIDTYNDSDAEEFSYNVTMTERQEAVYAQVANRKLMDLTSLTSCDENSIQQVLNYLDAVDRQLTGAVSLDQGSTDVVLDTAFSNYLLSKFEQTPFYWQRTRTVIRGMDPVSRAVIVDVDYKTIDFLKDVKADAVIPLGTLNYTKKMETRYSRWIDILKAKHGGSASTSWEEELNKFTEAYGTIEDILDSQNDLELNEYLYETGNQRTYSGMIDTEAESIPAKMSVRYILVPNYVLGVNLGITCKHMYVYSYALDSDPTATMSIFNEEGYITVTDSVYSLLNSYFKCIDEHDYSGLLKLTYNFGTLDRYFEDMFDTTYTKHDNFSLTIFNVQGTHIQAGVTVSVKDRAKGSNMTFPTYTNRYYVELELIDDTLQVVNMVLISSQLESEPSIITDEAETAGFVGDNELSNGDKEAIEKLICNFSALQLAGDYSSDAFAEVVDLSIAKSEMAVLKNNMMAHSGVQKAVWLLNYQQGTPNYASVRCKELYQSDSNAIVETVVTYEFIMKGNAWYVYKYNLVSSVKLETTNLPIAGTLCVVTPGNVESYTSQIKGTLSSETTSETDISLVFNHPEVVPTLKNGSQEQGLNTEDAFGNLSDSDFSSTFADMSVNLAHSMTYDAINNAIDAFYKAYAEQQGTMTDEEIEDTEDTTEETKDTEATTEETTDIVGIDTSVSAVDTMESEFRLHELVDGLVGLRFNIVNNRYATAAEKSRVIGEWKQIWKVSEAKVSEATEGNLPTDVATNILNVSEFITEVFSTLK